LSYLLSLFSASENQRQDSGDCINEDGCNNVAEELVIWRKYSYLDKHGGQDGAENDLQHIPSKRQALGLLLLWNFRYENCGNFDRFFRFIA